MARISKEEKEKQEQLNQSLSANVLRKKAKSINREYKTKNMLIKMCVIITTFFLICYGALAIAKKVGGNFQIDLANGRRTIALSATKDFSHPTDLLQADIPATMNNISYTTIPIDEARKTDGSNNGYGYMCYTFYLKNTGNKTLSYFMELKLLNMEKGLDNCIRVLIIRNKDRYFYAKAKVDTDNEAEKVFYYDDHAYFEEDIDTIPFLNENQGCYELRENLESGEVDKYTLIVWIEGSDPETTDEKKSGLVKMGLTFTVRPEEDDDE